MMWLEQVAARHASGESWEAILERQSVDQIKCGIREAGESLPETAIPFLDYLSHHTRPDIREAVAVVLGRHRYLDAVGPLLKLLADQQPSVRAAATCALSHLGSPDVVPLLERMLYDSHPSVCQVAATALGREDVYAARAESGEWDERIEAYEPILDLDDTEGDELSRGRYGTISDDGDDTDAACRRPQPGRKGVTDGPEELFGGVLGPDRRRPRPEDGSGPGWRSFGFSPPASESESHWPTLTSRVSPELRRTDRPRHLRGGYTAMLKDGNWEEGYIDDYISCWEGYKYQFSVAVSRDEMQGLAGLAELPAVIDGGPITLAVALLPDDDECLVVEDAPSVKLLQLPADGPSNVANFTVRGLKPGQSSLQILVYHRGCLVIRARTSPIDIKARPGVAVPFDPALSPGRTGATPVTAPVMNHSEDLTAIAERMQMDRFASLLIDKEGQVLLFALFNQDGDDQDIDSYHFVAARIPAESADVSFEMLRERLLKVVTMKNGLFGSVFGDSVDVIKPEDGKEALSALREAGIDLWHTVFGHPDAAPVRKQLFDLVSKSNEQGVLQIVSNDFFVPWQLMYVDDKQAEPKAELFWGMRFQIEHTLAKGVGLRNWRMDQGDEPAIAFINKYLPPATLKEHEKLFAHKAYGEDDVIGEFEREPNCRSAFYFYCHAEFDRERPDKCWIKLTDDRHKLTFPRLKRTASGAQGQQLEFDCAPLVFLNACESGQVDSRFYQSFVGFLLDHKKAGGVVGTETEMPAFFATAFAKRFWSDIRQGAKPVGQILYELRKHYWEEYNNPLGMLYSLYANAELGVTV